MHCFIFNGGSYKIEAVLRQLARILTGESQYSKQADGYDYMLGTHNDWWVNVYEDTRNFEVSYRYQISDGDRQALQRAICFLLGVSDDNGYNRES